MEDNNQRAKGCGQPEEARAGPADDKQTLRPSDANATDRQLAGGGCPRPELHAHSAGVHLDSGCSQSAWRPAATPTPATSATGSPVAVAPELAAPGWLAPEPSREPAAGLLCLDPNCSFWQRVALLAAPSDCPGAELAFGWSAASEPESGDERVRAIPPPHACSPSPPPPATAPTTAGPLGHSVLFRPAVSATRIAFARRNSSSLVGPNWPQMSQQLQHQAQPRLRVGSANRGSCEWACGPSRSPSDQALRSCCAAAGRPCGTPSELVDGARRHQNSSTDGWCARRKSSLVIGSCSSMGAGAGRPTNAPRGACATPPVAETPGAIASDWPPAPTNEDGGYDDDDEQEPEPAADGCQRNKKKMTRHKRVRVQDSHRKSRGSPQHEGVAISVTDTSRPERAPDGAEWTTTTSSSEPDEASSSSAKSDLMLGAGRPGQPGRAATPGAPEPRRPASAEPARPACLEQAPARHQARSTPASGAPGGPAPAFSGRPTRHFSVNERAPQQLHLVAPGLPQQHLHYQQQQRLASSPTGALVQALGAGAPGRRLGSHSPSRFNFGG